MANQETVSDFILQFGSKEQELKDKLIVVNSISELDSIRGDLQKLSQLVSEYAPVLPSYELRKSQLALSEVQSRLLDIEEKLRPKKKFKFQRSSAPKVEKPKVADETDAASEKKGPTEVIAEPTLSGRSKEKILLTPEDVDGKDIWLQSLDECTVIIVGVPSTLHLTQLKKCRLICGPVATSVFLDGCHESVFTFGCQQLRAHRSSACDFYLWVQSRAIIEDCDKCRFAPYTRNNPKVERDFEAVGFTRTANNWDQVDDFNWLTVEQQSPHWSILPITERINNWDD